MKNPRYLFFALFATFLLSSCSGIFDRNEILRPPCERHQTGTVCFYNDTRRDIKVDIGDAEIEVEERTTICVDVYEGWHDYRGKQGLKRWRGEVFVPSCSEQYVRLER